MRLRLVAGLVACALSLMGGESTAAPNHQLVIASQGVFFVGGRYIQTPSGTVMDGQMYVQYQIPAHKRHPYPIVLIHGHGQSGVNFLSTPDGREGWADIFLRQGYAVYVVDQAMRGRSAYDAELDGPLKPFTVETIEQIFSDPQASNLWPQAKLHDQWPGSGVKGDPAFDQFYASELASTSDLDLRLDELNRDDAAALLDRIGPAIILTHSRSGPIGWLLADARPKLVKAIVAVEPWGPPFRNIGPGGGAPQRPWGLTVVPLTFEPPVASPTDLSAHEEAEPSGPGPVRCWVMGGVSRKLPHLVGIPTVIVTGEASYHAGYDNCTSQFLTAAGVRNDWLQLGKVGIHGNAHMMMIEKNNREIALAIDEWLVQNVRAGPAR